MGDSEDVFPYIYQQGAGYIAPNGQPSNYIPTPIYQDQNSAKVQPGVAETPEYSYTPEQLGWAPEEAQRFRDAGVELLPNYMNKAALYGKGTNLSGDDPIQFFIDAQKKPTAGMPGKYGDAVSVVGIDPSSPEWDDAAQRTYSQWLIHEKWKPNIGAFQQSVLPAIQGIGSIAAVAGGLGALGAFSAPVAGAAGGGTAAAGSGGGGLFGTTATLGNAGGSGLFGTGQGLTSSLGGLYGTGVGTQGLGSLLSGAGSIAGGYGSNAISGGFDGLGGDVMGYSNATPITTGVDADYLAGLNQLADVGMGNGTSWLTDLGLPASYGNDLGALFDYGSSIIGGGSVGSSVWDSITNLLSPTGGNTAGGTDWAKLLGPLLGVGGAVAGGVLGNNAIQDSIDKMQKYYQPFYDLGVSNIPGLNAADPTGGSGQFIDQLKNYGTNFQFDNHNPAYTQQLAETTRLNDQNLAARGMYNSRAGLNLQDQSQRNLVGTEFDKQYARGYGNLTDLFNMTNTNAGTSYNKLLDMVKIGAGSSGSAGQGALASGQSSANLWSGLGAMPMNYAILQKLLAGGK